MRALAVETVQPTVERGGRAAAGTAVLTASGYIVARREAIVSSKIQGRLSELRVEEGSVVREGEMLARLESTDLVASVERAQAQVQQSDAQVGSAQAQVRRAEADLAEARRQLGVAERLSGEKLLPVDSLDAARSRVALMEAALGQATADAQRAAAARDAGRRGAERQPRRSCRTRSSRRRLPAPSCARWRRSARVSRPFRPA